VRLRTSPAARCWAAIEAHRPREIHAIADARFLGEFAGHRQQLLARVEADHAPATTDASGDFASDGTAAAADV
jgi:hypothetical protein